MSSVPLFRLTYRESVALLRMLSRWGLVGALVGVLSGAASALFLRLLAAATVLREGHPYLLLGLPLAGLLIGYVYQGYGLSVAGGNSLLLERIHRPDGSVVPFRMAPLVLVSTVITHLFGGSAGREGTAVQMGGTLASLIAALLRFSARDHRLLLLSGISGGFGSVFGTPLAGAVFGLEVLSVGKVRYDALIPCFVASCIGDAVCRALGVHHTAYAIGTSLLPAMTPLVWVLVIALGSLSAGAAALFVELIEAVSRAAKRYISRPLYHPFIGGIAIIGLTYLVGTRDYLGLSLPLIERSFHPGGVALWAFALKILFTAVTLGTGFKGGEVTPLFCIGATLGAAFAQLTGQPVGFFAALGFVAVFAGAANTPLACALLGIELFGSQIAVPLAAVCIVSYILSGHRGIYPSQLVGIPKSHDLLIEEGLSLRELRETKPDQAGPQRRAD